MTVSPGKRIPNPIWSADHVARIMKVHRMTVYRLYHAEELRGFRIGRSIRFDPVDVYRYLEAAGSVHAVRSPEFAHALDGMSGR